MQDRTESMTEQEQCDLWRLRTKWLGVYHIALVDDIWRAKRFNNVTHVLTADSAGELGDAIKRDYDAGDADPNDGPVRYDRGGWISGPCL